MSDTNEVTNNTDVHVQQTVEEQVGGEQDKYQNAIDELRKLEQDDSDGVQEIEQEETTQASEAEQEQQQEEEQVDDTSQASEASEASEAATEDSSASDDSLMINWDSAPSNLKKAYRKKVEELDVTKSNLGKIIDKLSEKQSINDTSTHESKSSSLEIPDKEIDPEGYQEFVNKQVKLQQEDLAYSLALQRAENELNMAEIRSSGNEDFLSSKKFMERIAINMIKDSNPLVTDQQINDTLRQSYLEGAAESIQKNIPFDKYIIERAKLYGHFPQKQNGKDNSIKGNPNLSAINKHKQKAGSSLGETSGKSGKATVTLDDLLSMNNDEMINFVKSNPKEMQRLTTSP